MIDKVLSSLPPDVQQDLVQRPVNDFALAGRALDEVSASVADLDNLGSALPAEIVDTLAQFTGHAAHLDFLLVVINAFSKRLESLHATRSSEMRVRMRSASRTMANAEIQDTINTDPWLRSVSDAMQSLGEIKAVLSQRERAYRAAADVASRAITAKQVELQQLKLEARRG